MPPGLTQKQFDEMLMASTKFDDALLKDVSYTALRTKVELLEARITSVQGHANRLDQQVIDLGTDVAFLQGQITALDKRLDPMETELNGIQTELADIQRQLTSLDARLKVLEDTDYPEPEPEPLPPLVLKATVTGMSVMLEANDHGPDATYAWKAPQGIPSQPTGRIVTVAYPAAASYTAECVCTHEDGRTMQATVSFTITAAPPSTGHVTTDPAWRPNLVDVNFDGYADTAAMMAASKPTDQNSMFGVPPWIRTYDGDVSPPTCSLQLVVNQQTGVKACRSNYVPPGSCGSVDRVTRAVGWKPAQQRIFAERVQMLSPNFNAHDPLCGANPGDFKNEGIDTVGDMAGNFRVMACNSANNENPLGTPAFNTPDPNHNDVYANVSRVVVPVGQRFSFLWDVKCSSGPTVADGHLWVGYKNHDTGELKTLHEKTGLKMSDGTAADKLLDKFFWCHNLDRAKPGALWNDTFSVKIGSNRPAWAQLP